MVVFDPVGYSLSTPNLKHPDISLFSALDYSNANLMYRSKIYEAQA